MSRILPSPRKTEDTTHTHTHGLFCFYCFFFSVPSTRTGASAKKKTTYSPVRSLVSWRCGHRSTGSEVIMPMPSRPRLTDASPCLVVGAPVVRKQRLPAHRAPGVHEAVAGGTAACTGTHLRELCLLPLPHDDIARWPQGADGSAVGDFTGRFVVGSPWIPHELPFTGEEEPDGRPVPIPRGNRWPL